MISITRDATLNNSMDGTNAGQKSDSDYHSPVSKIPPEPTVLHLRVGINKLIGDIHHNDSLIQFFKMIKQPSEPNFKLMFDENVAVPTSE